MLALSLVVGAVAWKVPLHPGQYYEASLSATIVGWWEGWESTTLVATLPSGSKLGGGVDAGVLRVEPVRCGATVLDGRGPARLATWSAPRSGGGNRFPSWGGVRVELLLPLRGIVETVGPAWEALTDDDVQALMDRFGLGMTAVTEHVRNMGDAANH